MHSNNHIPLPDWIPVTSCSRIFSFEILLAPEDDDSSGILLAKVVHKFQSSGRGLCFISKVREANCQVSEYIDTVLTQRGRESTIREERPHCTVVRRARMGPADSRVTLEKLSMESLQSGRQVLDRLQGDKGDFELIQETAREDCQLITVGRVLVGGGEGAVPGWFTSIVPA